MEAKRSTANQGFRATRLQWVTFALIVLYALVGLPVMFMAAIGEFTLFGESWIVFVCTVLIGLVLNISILVARIFAPPKKQRRRRTKQSAHTKIKAMSRQI